MPGLNDVPKFVPLLLAALLVATLMLHPAPPFAHSEEPAAPHEHSGKQEAVPSVALDERLGAKLPLDLTFRDETGMSVRLGDLVTGPTIILPVYYGCTNVCNYLQNGLARVLPQLKAKPATEYRVISVSFDETETPALAARARKMHLESIGAPFPADGWRFLTGDAGSIQRLTASAGYHFQRQGRDFVHPVASIIVSRDGTIVRYLHGTTFLPKDLALALLEAREGKVGVTVRRVVGYCFSFDPAGKTYVFNLLRVSATVVMLSAGGFLAFLFLGGRKRR